MAKVKAPLFSLEARGALAKTVVHFPWKGLNCVREYIIPSNPKSTAQMSQRGKFIEAVDNIHASQRDGTFALGPTDVSAYALLASTFKTPRTWFNQIVKAYVDSILADKGPIIWQGANLVLTVSTQIEITVYATAGVPQHADVRYGITKTALLDTQEITKQEPVSMWAATTPASLNDWIMPTPTGDSGYVYICIVAGTTGATEPTWPKRIGLTVVDATVTWECRRYTPYPMKGTITGLTKGQKYFLQPMGRAGEANEGSIGGIYHAIVT